MLNLQAAEVPSYINLVFFLSLFLIMYFFFLRPQVKKQKSQNLFTEELGKGDEVVTGSGLIGKISKIEPGVITLQIDQKTFVRVIKGAISKEMTEGLRKEESKSATTTD